MLRCTFGSSHAPLTSSLDKNFGPLPPMTRRNVCSCRRLSTVRRRAFPVAGAHNWTIYPRTLVPHHSLCLHLSDG